VDFSEKSVYHKLLKNTLFVDFGYDERDVTFDVTTPRGLMRGQATLVVELDRSSYSPDMKETNPELKKQFETDP
jgi:hypothetical protein